MEEDPPNATPLATDLIAALQRLQLNRSHPHQNGKQLIMSPELDEEGAAIVINPAPGLTVYLEDADFNPDAAEEGDGMLTPQEEGLFQGERMRGGIGLVKATVASMRMDGRSSPGGSGLMSAGSGKIARVPTPRPPVPE